jgi:hypothetical protein
VVSWYRGLRARQRNELGLPLAHAPMLLQQLALKPLEGIQLAAQHLHRSTCAPHPGSLVPCQARCTGNANRALVATHVALKPEIAPLLQLAWPRSSHVTFEKKKRPLRKSNFQTGRDAGASAP